MLCWPARDPNVTSNPIIRKCTLNSRTVASLKMLMSAGGEESYDHSHSEVEKSMR